MGEVKEVTRYVASDGSVHATKFGALYREMACAALALANHMLHEGFELGAIARMTRVMGGAEIAPVLTRITKDTGIAIPHWQCSDEACYHVLGFTLDGIRVGGAPTRRTWGGGYSETLSARDLARYVTASCASQEADRG